MGLLWGRIRTGGKKILSNSNNTNNNLNNSNACTYNIQCESYSDDQNACFPCTGRRNSRGGEIDTLDSPPSFIQIEEREGGGRRKEKNKNEEQEKEEDMYSICSPKSPYNNFKKNANLIKYFAAEDVQYDDSSTVHETIAQLKHVKSCMKKYENVLCRVEVLLGVAREQHKQLVFHLSSNYFDYNMQNNKNKITTLPSFEEFIGRELKKEKMHVFTKRLSSPTTISSCPSFHILTTGKKGGRKEEKTQEEEELEEDSKYAGGEEWTRLSFKIKKEAEKRKKKQRHTFFELTKFFMHFSHKYNKNNLMEKNGEAGLSNNVDYENYYNNEHMYDSCYNEEQLSAKVLEGGASRRGERSESLSEKSDSSDSALASGGISTPHFGFGGAPSVCSSEASSVRDMPDLKYSPLVSTTSSNHTQNAAYQNQQLQQKDAEGFLVPAAISMRGKNRQGARGTSGGPPNTPFSSLLNNNDSSAGAAPSNKNDDDSQSITEKNVSNNLFGGGGTSIFGMNTNQTSIFSFNTHANANTSLFSGSFSSSVFSSTTSLSSSSSPTASTSLFGVPPASSSSLFGLDTRGSTLSTKPFVSSSSSQSASLSSTVIKPPAILPDSLVAKSPWISGALNPMSSSASLGKSKDVSNPLDIPSSKTSAPQSIPSPTPSSTATAKAPEVSEGEKEIPPSVPVAKSPGESEEEEDEERPPGARAATVASTTRDENKEKIQGVPVAKALSETEEDEERPPGAPSPVTKTPGVSTDEKVSAQPIPPDDKKGEVQTAPIAKPPGESDEDEERPPGAASVAKAPGESDEDEERPPGAASVAKAPGELEKKEEEEEEDEERPPGAPVAKAPGESDEDDERPPGAPSVAKAPGESVDEEKPPGAATGTPDKTGKDRNDDMLFTSTALSSNTQNTAAIDPCPPTLVSSSPASLSSLFGKMNVDKGTEETAEKKIGFTLGQSCASQSLSGTGGIFGSLSTSNKPQEDHRSSSIFNSSGANFGKLNLFGTAGGTASSTSLSGFGDSPLLNSGPFGSSGGGIIDGGAVGGGGGFFGMENKTADMQKSPSTGIFGLFGKPANEPKLQLNFADIKMDTNLVERPSYTFGINNSSLNGVLGGGNSGFGSSSFLAGGGGSDNKKNEAANQSMGFSGFTGSASSFASLAEKAGGASSGFFSFSTTAGNTSAGENNTPFGTSGFSGFGGGIGGGGGFRGGEDGFGQVKGGGGGGIFGASTAPMGNAAPGGLLGLLNRNKGDANQQQSGGTFGGGGGGFGGFGGFGQPNQPNAGGGAGGFGFGGQQQGGVTGGVFFGQQNSGGGAMPSFQPTSSSSSQQNLWNQPRNYNRLD